jgi:DNA-binding transcriptional ArsR family regulator
MSLLPSSKPDVDSRDGDPRLIGLDDEDTQEVLEAISSGTARTILDRIHDEPRTPSELATETDTSIQNVSYHLENLQEVDLVQVAGTQYSEKGKEMNVYAPADDPLVMFVGSDDNKRSFGEILTRFLGATGLLAVLSVVLHTLVEGGLPYLSFTGAATGDAETQTRAADTGAQAIGAEPALPLATAVFLGGSLMLVAVFAWLYWEPEVERLSERVVASPLLGGRDRERSRRVALGAAVTAVVLAVVWAGVVAFDVSVPGIGPFGPAPLLGVALVGAATVQAYDNDGLLVSWLVAFAPMAGLALGVLGAGLAHEGPEVVAGAIGYAVIVGGVAGLAFGTGGFLLGAGGRRLVSLVAGSE